MSGVRRVTGSSIELLCDTSITGPLDSHSLRGTNKTWVGENNGTSYILSTPLQVIPAGASFFLTNLNMVSTSQYVPPAQRPTPTPTADNVIVNFGGVTNSSFRLITPHARVRVIGRISACAIGAGTIASTVPALLMPTFRISLLGYLFEIPIATDIVSDFRILAQSNTSPAATVSSYSVTSDFQIPGLEGNPSTFDLSIRGTNNFDKGLELQTFWTIITY
jgi:hypothetical protein